MIHRNEEEIMKSWHLDKNDVRDLPVVSVRCITYNHEKYIGRALDSFLMQETNFPFEIVVHDDCSTDRTTDIIKKYANKYPSIIRPIFENENQFSKSGETLIRIVNSHIRGKYVAMCEGDDYWCDSNKLQVQYEFMESNSEYVLCTHNTIIHDITGKTGNRKFTKWDSMRELNANDLIIGWNVHLSSYFMTRDTMNYYNELSYVWCGDYALLLYALSKGKVAFLPYTMSVYNSNNTEGATWKSKNSDVFIRRTEDRINFLKSFNSFTQYRFESIITDRINNDKYRILLEDFRKQITVDNSVRNYKSRCKELVTKQVYKETVANYPLHSRINMYLLTHSYYYMLLRRRILELKRKD